MKLMYIMFFMGLPSYLYAVTAKTGKKTTIGLIITAAFWIPAMLYGTIVVMMGGTL